MSRARHRVNVTFRSVAASLRLAACCGVLGAVALPVLAAEEVELSEVVVTAQFREQDLQKTPIAITAVNAEMMEARSQTSLNQIADQAPSITLAPQAGAYGPSMAIFMRGVGAYDFNPAFEPGVGIYVDDVYFPTLTGSIMDLLDLDRVEILRGPQGTLAGRNSIGGAVKLYSRLPDGSSSSSVAVTSGSRNRLDVRASTDFAITDSLFARISGVSKNQDGYVKRLDYGCLYPSSGFPRNLSSNTNCLLAREGEINYDAVRGILHFDNGGSVKNTLIVDYTDDDRIAGATVLLAAKDLAGFTPNADVDPWGTGLGLDAFVPPPGSYYNYGTYTMAETANRPPRNTPGRAYFRSFSVSNKVDVALTDMLQLESITAYQDYKSGFQNDNDLSPLNQQIGDGTQPMRAFTQEFRLNGTVEDAIGGGHFDWTLGAFYLDQRTWYPSYQDLRYSLLPFQQDDPIDASAKALFGHLSYVASDHVTLIGGLRYTKETKQYKYSRKTPDGAVHPQLGGLDGVVGPYSGSKFDWRVGAQFQLTDTFMTYASIATGFKGGGVNPRPFYPEQAVGFDPEEETSYEVGAKTELLNRHLRLNSAVFYTDYRGFQGSAQTCPPEYTQTGPVCSLIINVGTAHVKGVEVEANYESNSGLTLDASASYLDFKVVSLNPLAVGGAISIGNTAVYTPKWKWSVGLQRQINLVNGQSITPRIDASYKDSVFATVNNFTRSEIGSYTIANARVTWRSSDNNLEGSLEVTNLFDKYYITTIYDAWDRAGIISGAPGHPREWAITLKKRF